MTSATNLKKAATALNITVREVNNGTMYGLQLSDYVYYWWAILEDGIVSHIYSQRTGKTSKNLKRLYAAEKKIQSLAL